MTSEKLLYIMAEIEDGWIEEAQEAYESGRLPVRRARIKYLAAAAALAVVLLGAVRPAALAEAAQAVIRWFEDYVSYRFRTETTLRSVTKYELQLQGLGEDYRLIDEDYQGTMGSAVYQSADKKKTISFLYGLSDGEIQIPGVDLADKIIIAQDGTELHYLDARKEEQKASLTWVSGEDQIVFCISGNLSEEELLELRRHVAKEGEGAEGISGTENAGGSFAEILEGLQEGQAYAIWQPDSEHPILLVAEGTYETDGVNHAAIWCEVYGLQDGVPRYLGYLACGGTAYPLMWDENYIYVAGNHFRGRYGISEQKGSLCLSDGLSYVPAEEGYRIRRDAAVEETFDEKGEPKYISGGEWMDEESGEALLEKLEEESAGAEIICFTPYLKKQE